MAWGRTALMALTVAAATTAPASATVLWAKNICEPGSPATVDVLTISLAVYEYTFTPLPSGTPLVFTDTAASLHHRFVLPPGTYRLTYRHTNPAYPAVATLAGDVVIRPYKRVGGVCVLGKDAMGGPR